MHPNPEMGIMSVEGSKDLSLESTIARTYTGVRTRR